MIVAPLGQFKSEDGDRLHVFPLVNETGSGIRICIWLERLVALLKSEKKTNCPAFCDEEGYQLSAGDIERVFHPILEELQSSVNPTLAGLIPRGISVVDHYQCSRSFRRGAEMKLWIMELIGTLLISSIIGRPLKRAAASSLEV